MDASTQYAIAYCLSTTAGLRGFLALFAASVAVHLGWIHPGASFAWIGSERAAVVLAIFAVVEMLCDKIPVVDHALHAAYFFVRPAAAAILVGAAVRSASAPELYGMMTIGALNALIVHGSVATARAGSMLTTFGFGNVLLSFVEDAAAVGGSVVAFSKPLLGAFIALAFVALIVTLARTVAGHVRATAPRRDR